MDTNRDPRSQEAGGRVEHAKPSLRSRVEELGRRFQDVKNKVDLDAPIVAHPIAAVGIAFALGALLGTRRKRVDAEEPAERTIRGAVVGAVTALGMRLVKDAAIKQLAGVAKTWLVERAGAAPRPSERAASRERSGEAFVEH